MLILQLTPTFLAPVKFQQPIDGGKTKTVEFTVRFNAITATEVEWMMRRLRPALPPVSEPNSTDATEQAEAPIKPMTDQEIVNYVLCGFGLDVTEPDGSQVEFNPSNVARLCEIYGVRGAIVRSFFEYYVQAAAKN